MAGVEVEVCGYAVQGEVVLLKRDLPDLWALEVNVGDYAANEAEFDNANRPDGWNVWVTLAFSPAAQEQKPPESKRPRFVK